jgi:hypothetical protein
MLMELAVILNVACAEEAGTKTEVGTAKLELVFERFIDTPVPVAGTAAVNVTVQVALAPDESVAGSHWREDKETLLVGWRETAAEADVPFKLATTVAV